MLYSLVHIVGWQTKYCTMVVNGFRSRSFPNVRSRRFPRQPPPLGRRAPITPREFPLGETAPSPRARGFAVRAGNLVPPRLRTIRSHPQIRKPFMNLLYNSECSGMKSVITGEDIAPHGEATQKYGYTIFWVEFVKPQRDPGR